MSDRNEDWIAALVAALVPERGRTLSLDEIGEAIGTRPVGSEEVERLLRALEDAGATIVEPGGEGLVELLRRVLVTARELKREGRSPSPDAISERSGISARAVRVALLYADVIRG